MKNKKLPAVRETELKAFLNELNERYPLAHLIEKSYVVSRFWAWFSQIQVRPSVRIPVPRFLSVRDP